ncbi:unnamed protein product [Rotaria sp. Silwood1]|nr:unnamed protein product [Rotaria sp. Silwood1]
MQYIFYLLKIGNVSWEQVLQNGSISGGPSYASQVDAYNSISLRTTTTAAANLTENVDLRRQSIKHLSGMIKCAPQDTERITDARNEDIDYPILSITNTVRYLHRLQQYSAKEKYQATNTPKQNEQALRNFDLTDNKTIFADLVIHLYDEILKKN